MTARQLAQSAAQIVKPDQHIQPANQGDVQIAPQIFVPDVPPGGSNKVSEDDICMNALDAYEKHELGGKYYRLDLFLFIRPELIRLLKDACR